MTKRAALLLAILLAPPHPLAETRIRFDLLDVPENRAALERELDASDPAGALLLRGRGVIPELIPLLDDQTPTQGRRSELFALEASAPQPRVCDVALAIIEYHALCLFHESHAGMFHELPEAQRQKVRKRIAGWWERNKTTSVEDGVKDQLAHAESDAGKIRMARLLIEHTDDDEFGHSVLRDIVRQHRANASIYAAEVLADYGDTSAVDVFYQYWKSRPAQYESRIAFYLCRYGQQREWELLNEIARDEFAAGVGPAAGAVWSCVVQSEAARTNPYAIPIFSMALTQTQEIGSRIVDGSAESQRYSLAEVAVEALQKQLAKDFGYRPNGTIEERRNAVLAAQRWWAAERK